MVDVLNFMAANGYEYLDSYIIKDIQHDITNHYIL